MKAVKEIAIFAEGGGDTAKQRADLRMGFDGLLKAVKAKAQQNGIAWKLTCCGGRQAAYWSFAHALRDNPSAVNVLLVDSEDPVAALTGREEHDAREGVRHLSRRDQWDFAAAKPDHVHLVAQCMEAWIVADPDALERFYGQNFGRNHLPKNVNLEDVLKQDIYGALEKATSDQGGKLVAKGRYGKITHASKLLQVIDPGKVARHCPRFGLLVRWLGKTIDSFKSEKL